MQTFATFSALIAFGLISAAHAENNSAESNPTIEPDATAIERSADAPAADKLSFLKLASVGIPDQVTQPGDLIRISRKFANWTLRCDVRLSTNNRVCFVEQSGKAKGSGLVWRIAMNEQMKPIAILSMPANLDMSKGVRMTFGGLEKTLEHNQFRCGANACVGGFPFEGFVQKAITSAQNVGFAFTPTSGESIDIRFSMAGFNLALDAAARDPFGRDITRAVAKSAKDKPIQKPAAQAKPKKPAAKAQKPAEKPVTSNALTGQKPGLF